jgi:putative transposase
MAYSYSQVSIHAVFAVQGRENIISKQWRDDLHRYISGIITGEGLTSFAIGGWKDHVHIFFGMPPERSISDILKIVKSKSTLWINEKKYVRGKFSWQAGFGAFSYSKSQRDDVIKYIINQEEHHKRKSFQEEYLSILNQFDVKFDDRFIFEFYEDNKPSPEGA